MFPLIAFLESPQIPPIYSPIYGVLEITQLWPKLGKSNKKAAGNLYTINSKQWGIRTAKGAGARTVVPVLDTAQYFWVRISDWCGCTDCATHLVVGCSYFFANLRCKFDAIVQSDESVGREQVTGAVERQFQGRLSEGIF